MKRKAKLRKGTTHYGRKNVTLPGTSWDMGPNTAAQNAGKVIEDAKTWDADKGQWVNPNGVKRARRINLVEAYHNQGKLDLRQFKAAVALLDAYERTQRSAPAIKAIQVDTFPKPDAHIGIQIDRVSKLVEVSRHVPQKYQLVIECVVLQNASVWNVGYRGERFVKGMDLLREGLDALADGLKL